MYYVYLIECGDKTLYTGITTDIQRRLKEHSLGKGGAYTRAKKVRRVLYTEQFRTRSDALKREAEIKGWHREKKLDLIKKLCYNIVPYGTRINNQVRKSKIRIRTQQAHPRRG